MIVSKKSKTAEQRDHIRQESEKLLAALKNNPAWENINNEEQNRL